LENYSKNEKIKKRTKINIKLIVFAGLIIACELVLERLLVIYQTPTNRYTLAFIARVISGVVLGPFMAGVTGTISDVVGAVAVYGSINPLLSVVAFLRGVVYGVFLFKKRTPLRIIGAVLTEQLICSLLLTSLSLSVWYGMSFSGLIAVRIPQCAIMIAVQLVTIFTLNRLLFPRLIAIYHQK